MLRISILTVLSLLAGGLVHAQTQTQTTKCLPSTTPEQMIKALDAAIGGPMDQDRACLREVVMDEARLSPILRNEDGSFGPRLLTREEWIANIARRGHGSLYEYQVKVRTEQYGHIAHLWCTYQIRPAPDAAPTVTGINSLQAVFDGKRWRLLSAVWDTEAQSGPLAERDRP